MNFLELRISCWIDTDILKLDYIWISKSIKWLEIELQKL